MINLVYLVIFALGDGGITSQAIPQANMKQCQVNAEVFNKANTHIVNNGSVTYKAQKAYCIVGVK